VPASGLDAEGQVLAGALMLREATAPVGELTGALGQIHHLFKSMK